MLTLGCQGLHFMLSGSGDGVFDIVGVILVVYLILLQVKRLISDI